jgi:hypothetical protein
LAAGATAAQQQQSKDMTHPVISHCSAQAINRFQKPLHTNEVSPNLEVKRAVDTVLLCAKDAGKVFSHGAKRPCY